MACAIRKDELLARYGMAALDPYMLSLHILVERFCYEIGEVESGWILAECRNSVLDQELNLAWEHLKLSGTSYVPAHKIRARIDTLSFCPKHENIAALQIADLVVSPIGRLCSARPFTRIFESSKASSVARCAGNASRRSGSVHGSTKERALLCSRNETRPGISRPRSVSNRPGPDYPQFPDIKSMVAQP